MVSKVPVIRAASPFNLLTAHNLTTPLVGRQKIKKGHSYCVKLGDKEVEYHNNFKLILHTKLANPHYPPEVQAECTLINFMVTEDGLEDQLLAKVVTKEV
jgi:dynein heavy chain